MERRGAAPPAEHCCIAAFLQQPSTHAAHQHRYCMDACCNKGSCMFLSPRACQLLLLPCVYCWIAVMTAFPLYCGRCAMTSV